MSLRINIQFCEPCLQFNFLPFFPFIFFFLISHFYFCVSLGFSSPYSWLIVVVIYALYCYCILVDIRCCIFAILLHRNFLHNCTFLVYAKSVQCIYNILLLTLLFGWFCVQVFRFFLCVFFCFLCALLILLIFMVEAMVLLKLIC